VEPYRQHYITRNRLVTNYHRPSHAALQEILQQTKPQAMRINKFTLTGRVYVWATSGDLHKGLGTAGYKICQRNYSDGA
jgi:hypothetical protein